MSIGAILAIDTSTAEGSAVLLLPDGRMIERSGGAGEHYSSRLFRWLRELRDEAGLGEDFLGLSAVGIASGPGSFTGLRVGVATAKGIAIAAGCPLLSYPTLELCAIAAPAGVALRRPMISAGRGEIYTALYRVHDDVCETVEAERVLSPAELAIDRAEPLLLIGSGVELLRAAGTDLSNSSVVAVPLPPLAPVIARRCAPQLQGDTLPAGTRVDIRYVREAATSRSGNAV